MFYVDMRILIDKAREHFYMLYKSLILCKHGNILLYLTLKENTISNVVTIYIVYKYLPTREQTLTNLYFSSTGFAVNRSPPACADVSHDSGMDNGPSQTNPHTSKLQELSNR